MIRKLKHILNSQESSNTYQCSSYGSEIQSQKSIDFNSKYTNGNENFHRRNSRSPVNFLKKKIMKSTKSWSKLPKSKKLFKEEESAYESVTSLELANHEFEAYTRSMATTSNHLMLNQRSSSIDYIKQIDSQSNSPCTGQDIKSSSVTETSMHMKANNTSLKHSTINSRPDSNADETSYSEVDTLYLSVLERLSKCNIDTPAYIPILCTCSFKLNDCNWTQLLNKFNSSGINVRLIEVFKGVPLNALFYLSNLDLIYVKTAEETEGYIPRHCCKPIYNTESDSINDSEFKKFDDSIKYHSLSTDLEYVDLVDQQKSESNSEPVKPTVQKYEKTSQISTGYAFQTKSANIQQMINNDHRNYDCSETSLLNVDSMYKCNKFRDSGYKSESENQRNPVTELNSSVPKSITNKGLMALKSRSRLPISIRSNLNLTLMDDVNSSGSKDNKNPGYNNFTYKSPQVQTPKITTNMNSFKRSTTRRSLDSSILTTNPYERKLYSVSIELENNTEIKNPDLPYPDLDVKKIELDSLTSNPQEADEESINGGNKVWTVILKHSANNFQEISVNPGMLVLVIKEFGQWLYVKLVGFEHSNLNLSQQYGIIPRNCAVDLHEIISNSNKNMVSSFDDQPINRRKSQITAL